jgi:hypothetical protein
VNIRQASSKSQLRIAITSLRIVIFAQDDLQHVVKSRAYNNNQNHILSRMMVR